MLGLDDIENTSSTAPSQQNGRKFLILDASLAPRTKRTDIAPPLTRQKRLGEDVMFELLNCMSVPFSQDKNNVVHSYGQLFVQSILLHGILREKIKAWASSSQGYFPVVDAQDSSRTRSVSPFSQIGRIPLPHFANLQSRSVFGPPLPLDVLGPLTVTSRSSSIHQGTGTLAPEP
jgi:hypothetical protein